MDYSRSSNDLTHRGSYKHIFELHTPITNAIAVTDVKLPGANADRYGVVQ